MLLKVWRYDWVLQKDNAKILCATLLVSWTGLRSRLEVQGIIIIDIIDYWNIFHTAGHIWLLLAVQSWQLDKAVEENFGWASDKSEFHAGLQLLRLDKESGHYYWVYLVWLIKFLLKRLDVSLWWLYCFLFRTIWQNFGSGLFDCTE